MRKLVGGILLALIATCSVAYAQEDEVSFDAERGFIQVTRNQTSVWNMYVGSRCTPEQFDSGVLATALRDVMHYSASPSINRDYNRRHFPNALGIEIISVLNVGSYDAAGARTVTPTPALTVTMPYSTLDSIDPSFPENFWNQMNANSGWCASVPAQIYELGARVFTDNGGSLLANPDYFRLQVPGLRMEE